MEAPWITNKPAKAGPEHEFSVGRTFRFRGRTCEVVEVTDTEVTIEFYAEGTHHRFTLSGKELTQALK